MNTNKLIGDVFISGSKNAALPEICACLLTNEEVTLRNIPYIDDVKTLIRLLKYQGVNIKYNTQSNILSIKKDIIKGSITSAKSVRLFKKIRASYYLMGSLLSIKQRVVVPFPGGCNFEERPINYHIDSFIKSGAKVSYKKKLIIIKRKSKTESHIFLPKQSMGTTINIILSSVLTKGWTIIENASIEPEVEDLIYLLTSMGASIIVDYLNKRVDIFGVSKLHGTTHIVMPDRIEAGSYMILALAVNYSNIYIYDANVKHLKDVIECLKKTGVTIEVIDEVIHVYKYKPINGIAIEASPYPYFPTDLQQLCVSALLNANSSSIVIDHIYPNRVSEVSELLLMNGNIEKNYNSLLIAPSALYGTTVYAYDLRCGFSLIIAGSIATNYTIIENANIISRGYTDVINKLKLIGLKIEIYNE